MNNANDLTPQRKKIVLLGCSVAILNLPGMLIAPHIQSGPHRIIFVTSYLALMCFLLGWAIAELVKLKRSER